jgi:hypothetical protein
MKKGYIIPVFAALLLTAGACNKNKTTSSTSTSSPKDEVGSSKFDRVKPVNSLVVGCQSDVFDVSKGAQINYASGAKVIVPKDAFVDKNGNPVKGEVKLNFAEYNKPEEVIASGLPMCIETAGGEIGYFESAGMYEITAEKDGEELQLASGKNIEIQTMGEKTGEFNFYYYDEERGAWQEQEVSSKQPTPAASLVSNAHIVVEDDELSLPKPQLARSGLPAFDLKIKNLSDYGMDNWESLMWQFKDEKSAKDNKWLFERNWSSIQISGFNNRSASCNITAIDYVYDLVEDKKLGKKKKKQRKIEKHCSIVPVLFGNSYKNAMASYQNAIDVEKQQIIRQKKRQRMDKVRNQFVRVANVSNLGVHNWDRIIKQPETIVLNADFNVHGDKQDEDLSVVYMLTGDQKEIVTFYRDNFAFNPSYANTVMVILETGEIATFNTNELSPAELSEAKSTKRIDISLKPTGVYAESTRALGEFIRSQS